MIGGVHQQLVDGNALWCHFQAFLPASVDEQFHVDCFHIFINTAPNSRGLQNSWKRGVFIRFSPEINNY
jgi:hypothetical protein